MNHSLTTYKNWLKRFKHYGFSNTISLLHNLRKDVVFALKYYGNKFYLRGNTVDFAVFNSIFVSGEYDLKLDFEPRYIVDAGANIGASALYFKIRYPEALLIAVEPEKSNFRLLKKNLNNYQKVGLENCALWPDNRGLVISNPDAEKYAFQMVEATGEAEAIKGITIENLFTRWHLPHVDLLKMDIEGAEKLLFDAEDISWLKKVRVLVVELHESIIPGTEDAFWRAFRNIDCEIFRQGENHIVINRSFKNE